MQTTTEKTTKEKTTKEGTATEKSARGTTDLQMVKSGSTRNGLSPKLQTKLSTIPKLRPKTKPAANELEPGWQIVMLPVSAIGPNPFQPRVEFSEAEMEELCASVREHGVLQPVMVRTLEAHPLPVPENGTAYPKAWRYHLVAGERRLRASHKAKRQVIPAIVRDDLNDAQVAELAVVENVQRANLSAIEEARGYKRLMIEFRLKEERIARRVGKSVQTIRETLKLLNLPQLVQKLISGKQLSASHGHVLLKLAPFETICNLVAQKAVASNLSATALGENLLPNARELKGKSLLIELDYKTKFDWKNVCRECPHKAYVASGYSSYCLNPLEWQRKQTEATELAKSEAARVLEAARQQGNNQIQGNGVEGSEGGSGEGQSEGRVSLEQLPQGSYRDLSYLMPDRLPAGCSGACACRREVCDPRDPTRLRPICLEPERFSQLQSDERAAHQAARERQFTALWAQAKELLQTQVSSGNTNLCAALALWPLFAGDHLRYGEHEAWQKLAQGVGKELSLPLPWEALFDEEATGEAQGLALLREHAATELLQLMACLHLAQEAHGAIRWGRGTPLLFAVLGYDEAQQGALDGTLGNTLQGKLEDRPKGEGDEVTAEPIDVEEESEGIEPGVIKPGVIKPGVIKPEVIKPEELEPEMEVDEEENQGWNNGSEEAYWGPSGAEDEPYFSHANGDGVDGHEAGDNAE